MESLKHTANRRETGFIHIRSLAKRSGALLSIAVVAILLALVWLHPPSVASQMKVADATLVNGNFSLAGTQPGFGCTVPYTLRLDIPSAAKVNVTFHASSAINFWILSQSQFTFWNDTIFGKHGNNGCYAALTAPSVTAIADSNAYSGLLDLKPDTYFFEFDNANSQSVSGSITVVQIVAATSTTSSTSSVGSASTSHSALGIVLFGYSIDVGTLVGALTGTLGGLGVVVGWFVKTRRRRFVTSYLAKIDTAYNQYTLNREESKHQLEQMKTEIVQLLKSGRIDESHFEILDRKITQYLDHLT